MPGHEQVQPATSTPALAPGATAIGAATASATAATSVPLPPPSPANEYSISATSPGLGWSHTYAFAVGYICQSKEMLVSHILQPPSIGDDGSCCGWIYVNSVLCKEVNAEVKKYFKDAGDVLCDKRLADESHSAAKVWQATPASSPVPPPPVPCTW